ncbi:MAG: hypothetical protein CL987_02355 [Euryarchaeota archaeon]|nr:hypothetical protein [Euryarchaeota archaeon]
MRQMMVVFCCLTILPFVSAGGDPGVDTGPEIEGTSIAEIQYSKATNEGDVWEITMKLNEDAAGNNTTIKGESQICINAGSCLAPQYLEFIQNSELYWEASLIAKGLDENTAPVCKEEDPNRCLHTYVNWKIVLEYNDDETETLFPESGYYTSWSTCWFDVDHSKNDGWGGDGCPGGQGADDGSSLSALSATLTIGMLVFAAVFRQETR